MSDAVLRPRAGDTQESLRHLFYRFMWPFQYFRDVSCGNELQSRLNYRHNRAMRIYLPGFALKWGGLTVLWYSAGSLFECWPASVLAVAGCFIVGTMTLIVALVVSLSYLWLERFSELP